jgi:hypothetical protein
VRESDRFATFAQAMNSTSTVVPTSANSIGRALRVISSSSEIADVVKPSPPAVPVGLCCTSSVPPPARRRSLRERAPASCGEREQERNWR